MQRKRLYSLVALVAAFALLLTACAPVQPGAATAPTGGEATGPTTVTWAMWGSPEEIATHQKVADAFMAENADIKIEIWSQPWGDYFTKIQALWASGDQSAIPDVAFLWPTPKYAAEGVLENLDPFIEKAGYDVKDYWPALLESASLNGSIYGFPRDIGLEVLYYSKAVFDEVGQAYPTESWTWDDLTAAATNLTKKDASGKTERYGLAMEGGKYLLWVNQNKGSMYDDMRNPSKCTLSDPAAVQAIEYFAGLMETGVAMRDADLSQAGGDAAVFANGQAAMIIQNSSRVGQFNNAKLDYDVAVMPLPAGGQRAASAGGAAWVMSAGSDNKEAAWTFLSWLQSTNGGQKLYTASGEIFPALQSTAKSDAFLSSGQPPMNRQAFITEGENAKVGRFGYFPEDDEINGTIIGPVMSSIWAGEATPADVLGGVCEQVDTYLKDHGFPKQ